MARRKADFEEGDDDAKVENDLGVTEESNDKLSGLRQLIFLGRQESIVDVDGVSFSIATLTSGQQRSMMKDVMTLSDDERVPSMREAVLSRAIVSVNGEPLEDLYVGDGLDSLTPLEKRGRLISDMQFTVVERLFIEYNQMVIPEEEKSDENLKK